jgi:hypothetical protein
MTLYKTDFSEYATGSAPSDWTEQWNTGNGSASVTEVADSIGGKVLTLSKTNTSRYSLSWNDVGTPSDIEVLVRMRRTSDADQLCRVIIRGGGAAGTENAYTVFYDNVNDRWVVGKYVNGTFSTLSAITKSAELSYWWVRVRVQSTALKVKTWQDSYNEPANWDYETTDSSLASGWVGVGAVNNNQYYDWFAAETTSGSWPIPAPYSMSDFSLDLAVQANAFDYFKMILDVTDGLVEVFPLNLEVVAQIIDSFKMLLEVVLNKLDDFKMLLEVTDGTMFDNFAMLLDVVDGTVFDNFKMDLSVVSATPAFRSITAHRLTPVMHEVV